MSSSGDFLLTKSLMSTGKPTKTSVELCDVVSVVCFCIQDSTMMLVVEPNSHEYWIPSTKVQPGTAWLTNAAQDVMQDIFGEAVSIEKLLRLHKLWMPTSVKTPYINHAIFVTHVKIEMKKKSKNVYGKYKGKVKWSNLEEIIKFNSNNLLKSPEVLELMTWEITKSRANTILPSEYISASHFIEINEGALVTTKNTVQEQLVDVAAIDRSVQEQLYKEFFYLCFPAIYLTFPSFSQFVTNLGWAKEELPHLYRSADLQGRGGISFREFLYFLAATEPGVSHSGGPAELRCRYIFRYLDIKKDNVLDRDELRNFIVMLRKLRKQPLDSANIEKDLEICFKTLGVDSTHALTLSEFIRGVGELRIRGTSVIYRGPIGIQKFVKEISERETRGKSGVVTVGGKAPRVQNLDNYSNDANTKKHHYEMAVHTVKIQKTGTTINIDPFWKIDNATSFSSGGPIISEYARKESNSKFDQSSKSNQLLKTLRYVIQLNVRTQCYSKIESFAFNWGIVDPGLFAKNLIELCNELKETFKNEPRMLKISSPVYIMGDLHGNCTDLLYFERTFWQVGPGLCPSNLLFLGDYVDRGLFSLEVISYLFAYKVQSPRKVHLLRGNHEIRRVQVQWSFEKEIKLKFGEKLGSSVFTSINSVFDCLPLAAVIDGSIFCCHGGIPPPWMCPVVTAINDIPAVLDDPQEQSSLAWELMWNDPLKQKHMSENVAMELVANEGFAVNYRRGTAHIFSVEALEKFLSINGFTHLVRAHEVVEAGFYLQQKGHVMTVFSSSKYCGGYNNAACLLADQGKLRVLRLEVEPNPL